MARGGKRSGAGRPPGSGTFGEATRAVRLPVSLLEQVFRFVNHKGYQLPLYASSVSAGFPSPADDYIEGTLDLNEHLIRHPAATFLVKASGASMKNAGIHEGDILIVDRSLPPAHGKIVVAALDGQLTVKRLQKKSGSLWLVPENNEFSPIHVEEGNDLIIWGVVTNVIHPL